MFKAIVLACMVSNPEACWEFHDTWGPYASFEACRDRSYAMSNAIRQLHTDITPKSFKCVPLKGNEV